MDELTQLLLGSLGTTTPSSGQSASMPASYPGLTTVSGSIPNGISFGTGNTNGFSDVNSLINAMGGGDLLGGGSSNATSSNPGAQDLTSLLSSLGNTPSPNTMVQFNPSDFQVPDINQYVTTAMQKLAPYYQKLITEAQGDMNVAIQRLQQDYQTGMRYTQEDLNTLMTNAGQDLQSQLASFGLQKTQETNQLLDTLNKRGIALTQGNQPGQPMQVAKEGQAGTEQSMLSQDQSLRHEAIQRTYDRNTQQYQTTASRNASQLGLTQTRGTENAQRQYQQTGEQYQQQEEQQALGLAQMNQQQALQQQALNVQQKALQASTGQNGGTGSINSEEQAIAAGYGSLANYKKQIGIG